MNKVLIMVALYTLTGLTLIKAEVLIDVDFSRAGEIKKHAVSNKSCKGELPTGWADNSSFAPVWVEYSFGDEQGTRFQRTEVTRIDQDWAQFAISPLPDAQGTRLYRLSITCRNRTGVSIDIGLRQVAPPYRYYWKQLSKFSPEWESRQWEFELPENDAPMVLWTSLRGIGTLDIRALKLERLSQNDLIASIKTQYPDKGPANLVRISRFPLGIPSGWSIDRNVSDGDVATVEAAEAQFTPALKITSPVHLTVSSAPIELKYPIAPHTASLSVCGSGDWKVRTGGPGIQRSSRDFEAGNEWQRIDLPFNPKYSSPFCQLFLEGEGTLYIDKVQVGPTEKISDSYQPPMEAEIAVALAPGFDAGAAGVVFDDESAVFNIAATGSITGSHVHWKLFDITGQLLKEGSLKAAPRLMVTDLTTLYGSFRLELWLERDGRPISPCDEVLWHRLHRPRYWGRDAPDSPFAVHTISTTRHILMAKAIGINWTRLHDAGLEYCGWWNLETEKGKWRFFDTEIKRYRKHGIKIFAELGTTPPWASYYQDTQLKSFGYFDKFFRPKNLNDYANYVRVFCNRYKEEIDAFDVWNEPWIHAWWCVGYDHSKKGREGYLTSEHPQADFAELTKLTHSEVHKIIPDAQVFGVNTTTSGGISTSTTSMSGTQWTRGILEAGGVEHCDGIAFHAYTTEGVGYPGDSVERGISNAVGVIREKYNGSLPKPLWMTEGSPLIHRMGNGLYRHVIQGERSNELLESANRITRYHLSMLANGVTRMFIYSMHSHNGIFSTDLKQWNAFTTDDGALHPSGAAHAQLAWMLEDTRFKEIRPVEKGVYAYIFEGEGRSVAALSSEPEFEQLPLPASKGVGMTDLFGNPLPSGTRFKGEVIYFEAGSTEHLKRALMQLGRNQ